ncbi:hypothetical protein EDD65_102187 [Keratinibaculum paraultunense]|uniref:Cell division protein FtsL n=1 Tax=Keratinibaculum paraultunense TaxID=1278232 RepID=A0A4R3L054_9FIRM|nr:hypothetical protein [Keratinibaculum paraultunense]QQY80532.1 hypothetical protein JL105_04310 [Keratinibaculum paraultunense]TCS91255.1 hypothetical protein EDD65_102187 [Keratinibaculum paraultunense]
MVVANKQLEHYYPEEEYIQKEKERIQKEKEYRKKRIKKKKSKSKFIAIIISIMSLAMCLLILYGYASMTKIRLDITELENQKVELIKEKEALVATLEAVKSSTKIEEEAITKLGMDYPTEEQIVYLDINDKFLTEEEGDIKIVAQLKNVLNKIISLF